MYCSLTYFMSVRLLANTISVPSLTIEQNIELFFCLYAQHWNNPSQCNSNHSRLLGFFSTLPGIWRALQCIRRYYDTRNVFPHLVNCGKYAMTITYYATLSVYRIDRSDSNLALFSTFAAINAIYCCRPPSSPLSTPLTTPAIWDLFMDWSLLQPNANKRLLRDVRGYRNPTYYYLAMILDPILRFNWIFYSIYTSDLQHSSLVSFFVGFSEITRRGMWTLFRVENEHCANVASFKASRDVPLPYEIEAESQESLQDQTLSPSTAETTAASSPAISRHRSRVTGALEAQEPSEGMRRRAGTRTFTSMLANAHTQDFEKKRKPETGDGDNGALLKRDGSFEEGDRVGSSDEEDDDDEQDRQDMLDAEVLISDSGQGNGEGARDRNL
jgi:hypothetical protein